MCFLSVCVMSCLKRCCQKINTGLTGVSSQFTSFHPIYTVMCPYAHTHTHTHKEDAHWHTLHSDDSRLITDLLKLSRAYRAHTLLQKAAFTFIKHSRMQDYTENINVDTHTLTHIGSSFSVGPTLPTCCQHIHQKSNLSLFLFSG